MLISFFRVIKFALQDFWRNLWLSLITITIIMLTFISLNFLLVINFLTESAIKSVQDKIDINIYFKPETSDSQISAVKDKLMALKQIKHILYVSQGEALEKFRLRHNNDEVILKSLEELGQNPLGASLLIKANNLEDYPLIFSLLDNNEYLPTEIVQEKSYDDYKVIIDKIDSATTKVREVGLTLSAVFILITIIIVFNMIRVAIYTHREDIAIMKLVGATNSFVRVPFLLEGVFLVTFAGLITMLIWYPFLNLIQPYLTLFFGELDFNLLAYFKTNFSLIFGLELGGLAVLSLLSSAIAVGKYLKV